MTRITSPTDQERHLHARELNRKIAEGLLGVLFLLEIVLDGAGWPLGAVERALLRQTRDLGRIRGQAAQRHKAPIRARNVKPERTQPDGQYQNERTGHNTPQKEQLEQRQRTVRRFQQCIVEREARHGRHHQERACHVWRQSRRCFGCALHSSIRFLTGLCGPPLKGKTVLTAPGSVT